METIDRRGFVAAVSGGLAGVAAAAKAPETKTDKIPRIRLGRSKLDVPRMALGSTREVTRPVLAYCLQQDNKKIIYATDCEHKADAWDASYPFLEFIRNADLLIFDTQYSLLESLQAKRNWGHSSNMMAVDLAVKAEVKHLCMFHTEPTQDDISLARTEELTREYVSTYAKSSSLTVSLAYDGLEINAEP